MKRQAVQPPLQRIDGPALAAIAATLLFWSSAFSALRIALEAYTPWHLTFLRFLVASALFGATALVVRMPLPKRTDWPRLFAAGFCGITFYHTALNFGQVHVPAGTAALLIAMAPVFTAVLASRYLAERVSVRGWAGIGVSLAGVVVIVSGQGETVAFTQGALLILLAAASAAVYAVLVKPLFAHYSVLQTTAYITWAGTVPLLLFAPGTGAAVAQAPAHATWAMVYTGVFPAAIAYVTWGYALSRAPASRVLSFFNLNPVLAGMIAWLWIGEVPTSATVLGGSLALVGVILVNTERRRPKEGSGM